MLVRLLGGLCWTLALISDYSLAFGFGGLPLNVILKVCIGF